MLDRSAEIAYRLMPDVSRQIEALQAQLAATQTPGLMLRDTVQVRDVVDIASAWTGKPASDLTPSP
jgi:hypothetical protein